MAVGEKKTDAQKVAELRKAAEDKTLPQAARNAYLDRANEIERSGYEKMKIKEGLNMAKGGKVSSKAKSKPAIAIVIGATPKKMAKGGKVPAAISEYGGKEKYASKAAMMKHEKKESPKMEKKEKMAKGGTVKCATGGVVKKKKPVKMAVGGVAAPPLPQPKAAPTPARPQPSVLPAPAKAAPDRQMQMQMAAQRGMDQQVAAAKAAPDRQMQMQMAAQRRMYQPVAAANAQAKLQASMANAQQAKQAPAGTGGVGGPEVQQAPERSVGIPRIQQAPQLRPTSPEELPVMAAKGGMIKKKSSMKGIITKFIR